MKLTGAGVFSLFTIFLFYSSALCEQLVEVQLPITKLRFLPSASSDIKGIARKGQRFVIDGETNQWYRLKMYNTSVWISKDAVKLIDESEAQPKPQAAAPAKPQTVQPGTLPPATLRSAPLPSATPTFRPGALETGEEKNGQRTEAQAPTAPLKPRRPPKPPQPSRTWISQFSHIQEVGAGEAGKEISFFQVTSSEAAVLHSPEADGRVLLKAKKGDCFQVIEANDRWCKITVADSAGWIERSRGAITAAPASGMSDELRLFLIIGAAAVALILAGLLVFLRLKARTRSGQSKRFHALLVTKRVPEMQCVISNAWMPLDKYLSSIGFYVKISRDPASAAKTVRHFPPAVVFINWYLLGTRQRAVEILFAVINKQKIPLTVFFNAPDSAAGSLTPTLLRAKCLGSSFSDQDISELVTPTLLSRTDGATLSTGSALEGDIADGNLLEILQFIEDGKKTGCLLIEANMPLGMIYFGEGRIIHAAAANKLAARAAINFLLGLRAGRFRFLLGKQPKESDLNLSTLEVLMEWSKMEDEARRR